MKYPHSLLFRSRAFRKRDWTSSKNFFVRSADKPTVGPATNANGSSPRQPYDKFFVLDFEATCDNGPNLLKPQASDVNALRIQKEIIEFPCVLVEFSTAKNHFEIISCFHSYAKPIIHNQLTEFCTQLTGITQDMVSNSPPFDEVFHNFYKWYINHSNNGKEKSIIVTSGNWDLGNIFLEQCKLYPSSLQIPEIMRTWINIKKLFALTTGHYPYGIKNMLKTSNLRQIGNIHSGMDDCVNIINIMNHLARKGCVFKSTNKITSV